MIPYSVDYIIPGEVFTDETVLCIRCGITIMGLSYKEMPKINSPKEKVNVAHKIKFGNYRQIPVVMEMKGRVSVTALPSCKECVKEIDPERDSKEIVKQIINAMEIQSKWVGMPEASIESIRRQYGDAKIVRKLTPEELMENKILEAV